MAGPPPDDATTAVPDWSTRERIEKDGYEAICVPNLSQPPGCEHHQHVPGRRLPVVTTQPPRFLEDIPFERVQQALKDLLGLDSLRHVKEAQIGTRVVRAVMYATDREPATYVLARRVVR